MTPIPSREKGTLCLNNATTFLDRKYEQTKGNRVFFLVNFVPLNLTRTSVALVHILEIHSCFGAIERH